MTSPLPRRDSATADSTELSFAGSTDCTTDCRFWNTVLTSTVTLRECSTAPGFSGSELAPAVGTIRSTYLAPKAVLDLISASTLLGRYSNVARIDLQLQLRQVGPTRICLGADGFDFADLDAAQLDLGAVLHDQPGPVGHQRERNGGSQRAGEQQGGQRAYRDDDHHQHRRPPDGIDLAPPRRVGHARHPDRWKLPDCPYTDSVMVSRMKTPAVIDSAHRAADRLADAGRATGHGVAVVGVNRHHGGGHRQRLDERPQQVGRLQEGVEVVVVDASRLPVDDRRAEPGRQERHQNGDSVDRVRPR